MLGQPFRVKVFDRVDDPRVKLAPTLLQQSTVGDLVRERVLKSMLEIWVEFGLVEELGSLQAAEPATERFVWQDGDCLEQRERHVLADYRGDLQATFVLRGEPVNARRQHGLHRGRYLANLNRLRQPIPPPLSCERLRLHERPDGFLQEKGVAALDEELLEWRKRAVVPEERIQQLPR